MKMHYDSFTMVLPVCNEERRIRRVIEYYKGIAPLLVIDNYSNDKTEAIVGEYDLPLIKIKNNGATQTPEWVREVFGLVNTDYVLWLSASEFIPMGAFARFDEVARHKQYGMVENVVVSYTCGELIPLWGGRFGLFDRRIQRFVSKKELDIDAVYMHAPFKLKDPARCLKLPSADCFNIIHLRDSDTRSLMLKHLNYAAVEAEQIVATKKSFGIFRLLTLVSKEFIRLFLVPFRKWHGVTIREIWARIFMHMTIFWLVWEKRTGKGLAYSEVESGKAWDRLTKEATSQHLQHYEQ